MSAKNEVCSCTVVGSTLESLIKTSISQLEYNWQNEVEKLKKQDSLFLGAVISCGGVKNSAVVAISTNFLMNFDRIDKIKVNGLCLNPTWGYLAQGKHYRHFPIAWEEEVEGVKNQLRTAAQFLVDKRKIEIYSWGIFES